MGKKIALIIAHDGYQHIEYGTPKRLFEHVGMHVTTVSTKKENATGKDGSTTEVDVTLEEFNVADYDGIFFIGGPGALDDLDNQKSYTIAQEAVAAEKVLGAICISTRILAKAGVLTGKKATGWDGDDKLSDIYAAHDVKLVRKEVMVDGKIITATGPKAAQEFGQRILETIQ